MLKDKKDNRYKKVDEVKERAKPNKIGRAEEPDDPEGIEFENREFISSNYPEYEHDFNE